MKLIETIEMFVPCENRGCEECASLCVSRLLFAGLSGRGLLGDLPAAFVPCQPDLMDDFLQSVSSLCNLYCLNASKGLIFFPLFAFSRSKSPEVVFPVQRWKIVPLPSLGRSLKNCKKHLIKQVCLRRRRCAVTVLLDIRFQQWNSTFYFFYFHQ